MKPSNRRCALNGVLLVCVSVACNDAIVGRRLTTEEIASPGSSSAGVATSEASGGTMSEGLVSAKGGTRAIPRSSTFAITTTGGSTGDRQTNGNAAGAIAQSSAGSSSTDPSCASGIKVQPSLGVCATVPVQGDVDCNGTVDIVDALKLGQTVDRVQSYPLYEPAGDLNCDGCLTMDDANLIAGITAGSYVAHACDDSE